MGPLETASAILALMLVFLALGIWIFAAVGLVGVVGLSLILGMDIDIVGSIMKTTMWRAARTWELAAVPAFIFMGELIFRTDMSERLFRGLAPWVDYIPGRLLHTNIMGCTLFAAVSGSTTATTATIGKITTTALNQRKYDPDISVGSLAGAGSLGLMIPPSISFIIYGVLADASIAHLFAAGVFPGLLIAGLYSGYIMLRAITNPSIAPRGQSGYTRADRVGAISNLLPIISLMLFVLGGLYTGLATPSEAAALGVVGALLLAVFTRQLKWTVVKAALIGTINITTMAITILVAANFLSSAMAYLHVPQEIANMIALLGLPQFGLILLIGCLYLVLGLFLDGLSIMVMTLPITLPLITAAGFDVIWFGVFIVVMIELGLVTPPIGFNLFVLQGMTGYPIGRIAKAAFPFFLLLCLAAVILTLFPGIALWLPAVLFPK